ncbi:MAG TPA: phosphoglycolate phosphatase [Rhodanobacteraceae bacterium]|nr:phosphoglycolate phosphatase [Rhodanobacteraceae bacterium]
MSFRPPQPLAGVLFDLDGTLVDSATDLYAALEALCAEQQVPPPPYAAMRERVSRGATAMLRSAFPQHDDAAIAALRPRFLELYAELLDGATRTFPGVDALLDTLEARGIGWGVVTNKPAALTGPLLQRLGLDHRCAALVCGDTLTVCKPDPEPLLHACRSATLAPAQCVFVGDDRRDIEAGRAAGMPTIAAAWGYLDGGDPQQWQADAVAKDVAQLARLLALA